MINLICITNLKISVNIGKKQYCPIMKLKIKFISDILMVSHTTFKLNENAINFEIKIGVMIQGRHSEYMTSFNGKMKLPHWAQKSQNRPHISSKY